MSPMAKRDIFLKLQQRFELLWSQTGVACDFAHGKWINGVVTWNGEADFAVGHDGMFPFASDSKANFLENLQGFRVTDVGKARHA